MKDEQEQFRLTYSWDMILCINDFINCVSLHKSDLKSPRNIGLVKLEIGGKIESFDLETDQEIVLPIIE